MILVKFITEHQIPLKFVPTAIAGRGQSLGQVNDSFWHFSDVLRQSSDVRCLGLNRPKSAAPEGRLLPNADVVPWGRPCTDGLRPYML